MKYYLGIDLGGTNIAAGVVNEDYKIIGRSSVKTGLPRPMPELIGDICAAGRLALESCGLSARQLEWIGIGSPGAVDTEKGTVEYANNIPFADTPLSMLVEKSMGRPVYVENDANAACIGEILAGGAKGCKNVVAVTIGTGVGAGVVINGRLLRGHNNSSGELGHVGMVYNGRQCNCGRKGCIEAYCSARALTELTLEAMEKNPGSLMWEISQKDGKTNARTAFKAMKEGDAAAAALVWQYIEYLGYAVTSYINIFQPEIMLIGGGVSNEGEGLIGTLREYAAAHSYDKNPLKRTKIMAATLGNDAGIIGAALLGNFR